MATSIKVVVRRIITFCTLALTFSIPAAAANTGHTDATKMLDQLLHR